MLFRSKIVNFHNIIGLSDNAEFNEMTHRVLFIALNPADKDFNIQAVRVCKELVPEFADIPEEKFTFQTFSGGLTNILICVVAPTGMKVLLRTYGPYTEYLVDRRQESTVMNTYGQKVYGGFLNGIVYTFTPGRTLDYEEFRKPEITKLMLDAIVSVHKLTPPLKKKPVLFNEMRAWLHNLPTKYTDPAKQKKFVGITYEKLSAEIDYVEKKLTALNSPVICCHNDLYLKNFIYDEENNSVKLIDFEYSSWNYQAFDLANHIGEWCGVYMDWSKYPSRDEQDFFLRTYLEKYNGCKPTDEEVDLLYDVVNKFQLATNLLWSIWGFVDASLSKIDWDYLDYAFMRLERYYKLKEIL